MSPFTGWWICYVFTNSRSVTPGRLTTAVLINKRILSICTSKIHSIHLFARCKQVFFCGEGVLSWVDFTARDWIILQVFASSQCEGARKRHAVSRHVAIDSWSRRPCRAASFSQIHRSNSTRRWTARQAGSFSPHSVLCLVPVWRHSPFQRHCFINSFAVLETIGRPNVFSSETTVDWFRNRPVLRVSTASVRMARTCQEQFQSVLLISTKVPCDRKERQIFWAVRSWKPVSMGLLPSLQFVRRLHYTSISLFQMAPNTAWLIQGAQSRHWHRIVLCWHVQAKNMDVSSSLWNHLTPIWDPHPTPPRTLPPVHGRAPLTKRTFTGCFVNEMACGPMPGWTNSQSTSFSWSKEEMKAQNKNEKKENSPRHQEERNVVPGLGWSWDSVNFWSMKIQQHKKCTWWSEGNTWETRHACSVLSSYFSANLLYRAVYLQCCFPDEPTADTSWYESRTWSRKANIQIGESCQKRGVHLIFDRFENLAVLSVVWQIIKRKLCLKNLAWSKTKIYAFSANLWKKSCCYFSARLLTKLSSVKLLRLKGKFLDPWTLCFRLKKWLTCTAL